VSDLTEDVDELFPQQRRLANVLWLMGFVTIVGGVLIAFGVAVEARKDNTFTSAETLAIILPAVGGLILSMFPFFASAVLDLLLAIEWDARARLNQ
jgi:cytochrome bd-type quinol oxidase subunit 2